MIDFWIRADVQEAEFHGDELRDLPGALRRTIQTAGVLKRAEYLRDAECDACGDGHVETVQILIEPSGTAPRAYIKCPRAGRVFVENERLEVWRIDLDRLAGLLATAVGLPGPAQVLVQDRLWLLGSGALADRTRDVFLVRGITWPSSRSLIETNARLATSPCPLILCLKHYPDNPEWHGNDRVVLSVAECDWSVENPKALLDRINSLLQERQRLTTRADCLFRKDGQIWTLSFGGKTAYMEDSLGVGYISELLRKPRTPIEAVVLAGARDQSAQPAVSQGLEVADQKTIDAVQAALEERRAELESTAEKNWPRRGDLNQEISKLEQYLAAATALYGQARKAAGTAQRSRSKVTNAINRAIKSIAEHHPSLGRHLDESIQRGTSPMYAPAEVPEWCF